MKAKTLGCLFAAVMGLVNVARAETYSWTGAGDDNYWSTEKNWSGEVCPSSTDIIKPPVAPGEFTVDLENTTHTVSKFSFDSVYDNNSRRYPSVELRNGTLVLTDGFDDPTTGTMDLDSGVMTESYTCPFNLVNATLKVQSMFKTGCARAKGYLFSVGDGSTFVLDHVNLYDKFTWIKVLPGGTADFTFGTTVQKNGDSTSRSTWSNEGGTFSFPAGFTLNRTAQSGWGKRASFRLQQHSGVMNLGGNVSLGNSAIDGGWAMGLFFQWFGGTVHALSNVTFNVDARYKYSSSEEQKSFIESNSVVTAEVDAGKTMDMSVLELRDGVTFTKTGAGSLILADVPYSLDIQGGTTTFSTNSLTAMGTLKVCAGASFTIANAGTTVESISNAGTVTFGGPNIAIGGIAEGGNVAAGTFAVSGDFSLGDTIVTTADATLRAKIKTDIRASLAALGFGVAESGNSLVTTDDVVYVFNSSAVTDLNAPDGWENGYVGIAGKAVVIAGAGTSAVMGKNVPAYSSISVEGGASLTVAAERELPATTLESGTQLNVNVIPSMSFSFDDYILKTDTLVGKIDTSHGITEITDITALAGGGAWGTSYKGKLYDRVDAAPIENGTKLRVQFKKYESPYTKCVIVEFSADAEGNVYAKATKAAYVQANNLDYDFTAGGTSVNIATSDSTSNYGVKGLSFTSPYTPGALSVAAVGNFATTGSGTVTVDVAGGNVLDLSGATVTTAAKLVKTGDGTILFGDTLPSSIEIAEGDLAVRAYVEYDLAGVTIGSGVGVKVCFDGTYNSAVAQVQPNGKTIFLSSGTYVGVGGWNELANWASGGLPGASDGVRVHGVGSSLSINDSTATMPASITLEEGTSAAVSDGIALPGVHLESGASLEVVANASVSVGDISAEATAGGLPTLIVASGATLTVPAGQKFSNIHLVLCEGATLTESGDGPLVFGYAEPSETTYFAMHATNATITALNSANVENSSRREFAVPAEGGTVVVEGDIVLKDCTITYDAKNGFAFGLNNPMVQAFSVIADNTPIDIGHHTYIAGGAHLVLTNNSVLFRRRANIYGHDNDPTDTYNIYVQDRGKVTLVDGGEIRTTVTKANATDANGHFGSGVVSLKPADEGFVGIEILEGGVGCWWKTYGDGTGVIRYAGGVQKVFRGHWFGNVLGGNRSRIYNRLKGVEIAENCTLLMIGFHDNYGDNDDGMHPFYIDSPFTGMGDFVVTNTWNGKTCEPHLISSANTCVGRIMATDCAGTAKARIYFANGANWSGTVVADGKIFLESGTNIVSFGALDLQADFPVKVWKPDGEPMTNDTLNVGTYLNNGGALVPELATDGAEFSIGDSFVVGKIAKDGALPRVPAGWVAKKQAIDGDDANDDLILKRGMGLQVLVR